MKASQMKTPAAGARKGAAVERWTVERLDRDAGLVRVESVPMLQEHVTGELLAALEKKGLEKGMDKLSLWNPKRAKIRRLTISGFVKRLGFRASEEEKLSENMVFWVVRPGELKKAERVYHATEAARVVSKEIYYKAARIEGS